MALANKIHIAVVAAAGLAMSGTAALASVVTFNFASANSGSWSNSLQYGTSALGLTVTGGNYPNGLDITSTSQVRTYAGLGLGVLSPFDTSGQIDGSGGNDAAIFSFSKAVALTSIGFTNVATNGTEYFDLFTSNGGVPKYTTLDLKAALTYNFTAPVTATTFGIGAYYSNSAYYVSSVTVSYPDVTGVPLPATGGALLAGLAALGAMRRRRA